MRDSRRPSLESLKPRKQVLSEAELPEPAEGWFECQAMWRTGDKGGFQPAGGIVV